MKLIIDKDEVIVDCMGPLLNQYNADTGERWTIEDIPEWVLPREGMWNIFERPNFFLTLNPFPGAIPALHRLAKKHDIIIATSPSKSADIAAQKVKWMELWLPELKDNLYLVERKDRIIGDLIWDDCPRHVTKFNGIRVVNDRRWNRELALGVDVDHRIKGNDWGQFEDFVASIESGAWKGGRPT